MREELWRPKYDVEMVAFEAKQKEEMDARQKEEEAEEGFASKVESSFVSMVDAIFFSSLLAPSAEVPAVEAVYDFLIQNAMVGVAGLSAIIALILAIIIMPKTKATIEKEVAKAKVGEAKKKDVTPKDDDEDDKEDTDEDASPTRRSRRNTRRD